MCGAECLSHCLFRIGETFRRRGFGANFGFSLERGNMPNDYFRFCPCFTIAFIWAGEEWQEKEWPRFLDWTGGVPRRNRWQSMSQIALSQTSQSVLQQFYFIKSFTKEEVYMTHLEAEALHGFLLVVSQSRTRACVSSPRVPSWPGWMKEWSHPILPLQAWHPDWFLVQAYISTGPLARSETQYKEDDGWVGATRGWASSVECGEQVATKCWTVGLNPIPCKSKNLCTYMYFFATKKTVFLSSTF